VLRRGPIEAVIVDNEAAENDVLPRHRGGYSGVASLKHANRRENLFVPEYAGLNFEHIHDGTTQPREILFEPRNAPMQLRVIDEKSVELFQPATPHWNLESCQRFELLEDGAIQLTIECIPRRETFQNGYIGLFWASYIHQPESLDIHFRGFDKSEPDEVKWTRGVTPAHGTLATHVAAGDRRLFPHDDDFPLTLVFNRSEHTFDQPWYYGISHGMAYVQVFRTSDQVRFSQSPSGGGDGNPAWDFQFFIPQYEVGRLYQFVMRAIYVPFESPEQVLQIAQSHQQALEQLSRRK
jgi:hypothetical protein